MPQEKVEVPISGKIVSVDCKVGATVKEGDILCTIESMKMENPIMAPVGGTIKEVGVVAGKNVNDGDLIAVIVY